MINNFGESSGGIKVSMKELEIDSDALKESQVELTNFGNEGLICSFCGGPAKRIGNCQIMCTSCKQTQRSGCGE